ncbi:exopolysaccharide biosynthesis polyprenyl glycosylphosphotransferase [Listeria grayi]|uniref:Exopolysaccharide biosynthesis polyprenyl glycosylphosphotransferase n=1 Tax=Listeria grayi TaxID=1641 RepID=A0A378MB65_LISGR|nr:exopolysaccharide biosynthesis polyprenyl glycosylphosphotransferase [Listeria grayi]
MPNLSVKWRLITLLVIDSIIVTFSVFLGYYILEPFFKDYSMSLLILSSVILLISHHAFAELFNLYHRAWEYASVSELMLIVKSVTGSVLTTVVLISLITREQAFLRLYFITWMMHLLLIGGSRVSWRMYRRTFTDDKIKRNRR